MKKSESTPTNHEHTLSEKFASRVTPDMLFKLRMAMGLNRTEMADLLAIHRKRYSRLEDGTSQVDMVLALAIGAVMAGVPAYGETEPRMPKMRKGVVPPWAID